MLVKECERINLDRKGRFYLFKAERAQFGEKVIISKERNHLLFFTEEEWNQLVSKKLTRLKGIELRRKKRILFSSTSLEKIDKQGRVSIPAFLRKEAR